MGATLQELLNSDEERDLIATLPDNPDNFRRLYRHYFDRVFAYVVYRVGRRQDAEDVTSTIFMHVIEKIGQFEYRGEGSFAAWLFRIAYNNVQQFYRQHQQTLFIPLDDLPEIKSSALLPDEMLLRQEQFTRLQHMVQSLSVRRQEVISLRFFGELQNKEIALVLGLDERTVASHLSRALDDLQQKYQEKDIAHE